MLSYVLGLLASSAIRLVSAQDLLACGNAFYVQSQYTCFDDATLCPVENGQATQPCGADCYLPAMYSCNDGALVPPAPSDDGTFLVQALESPFFDNSPVEAAGLAFLIGGSPATYCPDEVAQLGACPSGSETVWTCSGGFCSLNVEVPGGQQIYVAPNGAVGYTQAHSAFAPPGSAFSGFTVNKGQIGFGSFGFQACPAADGSSPQVYVAYSSVTQNNDCYDITLATVTTTDPGFAAWQYT